LRVVRDLAWCEAEWATADYRSMRTREWRIERARRRIRELQCGSERIADGETDQCP